ncbi:MAG: 16S rRNA (cytidine(1402)-2'-O)-methyltransferase [Sphingomonadales bacterium]
MSSGKLYLVATPVGNLSDMTFRAVETLKRVDAVLAEDTRNSKILFNHFDIQTPLESLHQHNEHQRLAGIIDRLQKGAVLAQISDAGTPGISDPGFLLARACVENDIPIEVIPGATAFIPALLKSGFALHRFVFEGFLPQKKGRQTKLLQMLSQPCTVVFYESPHKLLKTLQALKELGAGDRKISVSRELTKKFEETVNGSVDELILHFTAHSPKGEFVVVLQGTDYAQEGNHDE